MRRKKSSYAQKHTSFLPSSSELSSAFVRQNADLWDILRHTSDFEPNFLNLPYDRQIAMIDLFADIMRKDVVISPDKFQRILLDQTYNILERLGWMTGSFYEEGNIYFPLSDDEKKLVRMECYGSIDIRHDRELSACYKYFKNQSNRGKYKLKDYNLQDSPMWRVFNQFESFRGIAASVRRYFYEQGFNPDALKVMSVNDYCDVIHNIYAATPESIKAHFLQIPYKKKFVIGFMKARGKEFYQHLLERGLDERKINSLCRSMAKYGMCDIDHLVVTETYFTPRVLKDLQKHQYDVSRYQVGDKIPESLLNQAFKNKEESLLLARDENGLPLNKDDMPHYEVHHKNAVKFAANDDYLAKINYPSNLMLVEHELHRAFYHGFDDITDVTKSDHSYFSRVNTVNPEMCLIDDFIHMIYCNLEDNENMRRRISEDKKNVVNYYQMQLQRFNDIPVVAGKYGIEYSKNELNNEHKNLRKVLQVEISIPADDLHIFNDWKETNTPNPQKNSDVNKNNNTHVNKSARKLKNKSADKTPEVKNKYNYPDKSPLQKRRSKYVGKNSKTKGKNGYAGKSSYRRDKDKYSVKFAMMNDGNER